MKRKKKTLKKKRVLLKQKKKPVISKFSKHVDEKDKSIFNSDVVKFKKADLESGSVKNVLLMSIGPASGHGLYVDEIMLDSFFTSIKKKNRVRSHLSHENIFGGLPKELTYIGNIENVVKKDNGVYGDFVFSKAAESNPLGDFKTFVMDRIEDEEPEFGFSAHVRRAHRTMEEEIDGHIESATITDVFSVDLVEDPATTSTLYFSSNLNKIAKSIAEFNKNKDDSGKKTDNKEVITQLKSQIDALGPALQEYLKLHTKKDDNNNSKGDEVKFKERLKMLTKLSKKYDITSEQVLAFAESDKEIDKIVEELDEKFSGSPAGDKFVSTFKIPKDERDKKFTQFSNAILYQRNIKTVEKIDPKGLNEFGAIGLQSLFRLCAQYSNRLDLINTDPMYMLDEMFAANTHAQGSDDFINILSNVLNKSLLAGYNFKEMTFEKVCGRMTFNDFKTNDMTRLTEYQTFDKIPEGIASKFGQFKDNKEQARLDTHGTQFILSRKAMINDEMDAFTIIAQAIMRALKRYQNQTFWDIVYNAAFAGPTMLEVANLFTTGIGNLVTPASGATPDITTLDTAYKWFARLTSQSPKEGSKPIFINAEPKYLVHSPQDGLLINELTQSAYYNLSDRIKEGSQISNIHADGAKRNFIPIQEAYLEHLDATNPYPWYLFSDPTELSTMQFITLRGAESPYTASEPTKLGDPRGFHWAVEHDFAFAPSDYRGIYCNPGPQ